MLRIKFDDYIFTILMKNPQLQTSKCEVLYGMGGKNWYVEDSVPKTIMGPNCFWMSIFIYIPIYA